MGDYVGVQPASDSTREFAATYTEELPPSTLRAASLRVCEYADDADDARSLLLTLGLIGPADRYLAPTRHTATATTHRTTRTSGGRSR